MPKKLSYIKAEGQDCKTKITIYTLKHYKHLETLWDLSVNSKSLP